MKLISFIERKDNRKSYGLFTDRGVVDIGQYLAKDYADLKAILAFGMTSILKEFESYPADYQSNEVTYLPVIELPNKIFGVGMNYQEKRLEFNESNSAPTLFIRFPDSQTGHEDIILKPAQSNELDYEGELAIVIGKAGKNIARQEAMSHVAGYSCYMDGSVRDWQHSWFTAGKNWPRTGAFGPWLVTADEITDPHNLTIETYLNGCKVQSDRTSSMIHQIPNLIEYISTFSALSPGDVILTGSPGGVGKKRIPPLFLKEGDTIEVCIERIGTLRNTVQLASV
ncbi:fumarylacetoacetate hydrolase family protein [Pseudogulbenkiania ferrooxidans]|uniref:5-carboxymethyl-2-hydroxymuconate Delta-isomerase n=1 Tax=Pseudogulbenkiania ferrooxidans 2002 TaxID=279714 RepID=B9Z0L7_9NEIS|nr:fumarylacetoacetate hydrolase family protein [Pseudogulbenkiania ferrooxidans]EEG09623.1 5-carboxymethyl-2-hydroxymuconate Delta-isomerase [Pseudogulbenkiania ferrooxidans 2002]